MVVVNGVFIGVFFFFLHLKRLGVPHIYDAFYYVVFVLLVSVRLVQKLGY